MWDTVDTTAAKSTHLSHDMSHVDEVSAASFGLFGRDDLLANLMDLMDHGGSAVVSVSRASARAVCSASPTSWQNVAVDEFSSSLRRSSIAASHPLACLS